MIKNTRFLLGICISAIILVLVLQFYWISNYYGVTRFNFEREVNMAFEDAVKKEFSLRCDTIEMEMVKQLLDTSAFTISSKSNRAAGEPYVHSIGNAKDHKDATSFSSQLLPDSLKQGDTAYKRAIVTQYAHLLRSEDLENHVVYFRTQNMGKLMNEKVKQYGFDTARLRPVLQDYLSKRNISAGFSFHLSAADSMLNHLRLPDSLANIKAVVTKSFPTYKWWDKENNYVRAVFYSPGGYIWSNLKWVLTGSIALILLIGCCIYLLLASLFREKKLSAIKNDFINNITHELKTPLATVSAAVEALDDFEILKDPQKAGRYMGYARTELNRLNALVNNILNISLYEQGNIVLNPEKIVLEETITKIADSLVLTARKPVTFQLSNRAAVESITADKALFSQAIINIMDNAIKYSGASADIRIECYEKNNFLYIECSDKGEGIAAASQPYIFDKFYREPRKEHAVKGHGLGLNYVKEIVTAHKGQIQLHSVKGKGTTVITTWPL